MLHARVRGFSMPDSSRSTPKAVEIDKTERCFQGFYRLDKLFLRHELFHYAARAATALPPPATRSEPASDKLGNGQL